MCGILYAKNLKNNVPVNETIKALYLAQKSRGTEGFGYVAMSAEKMMVYRATQETDILAFLNQEYYDEIMFHHRLPTSTKNTLETTHPFECKWGDKTYYFIHNGIVWNDKKLHKKHKKLGIKYSSYDKVAMYANDSEALAWDFVLWLNGEQTESKAQGSAAYICLEYNNKTDHAEKLYFGHNSQSPLHYYQDKNILILSSETGDTTESDKTWYWDYAQKKIFELDNPYVVASGWGGGGYGYWWDKKDTDAPLIGFEYKNKKKKWKKYDTWEKATITNAITENAWWEKRHKLDEQLDELESKYADALLESEQDKIAEWKALVNEAKEEIAAWNKIQVE